MLVILRNLLLKTGDLGGRVGKFEEGWVWLVRGRFEGSGPAATPGIASTICAYHARILIDQSRRVS